MRFWMTALHLSCATNLVADTTQLLTKACAYQGKAHSLRAQLRSIHHPSLHVQVGSQLAGVGGSHSWASDQEGNPEGTLAPEGSPAPEGKLAAVSSLRKPVAVSTLRNLAGVAVRSHVDHFPKIQERCLSCRLSPGLLAWPHAEKEASLLTTSCIAWPGLQLLT